MHQKEAFYIKDRFLKLRDKNMSTIIKWMDKADQYILDKDYYKALEKLQDALLLVPDYKYRGNCHPY